MPRLLLLLALTTVACGSPATVEQCEEILERVARLETEGKQLRAEEVEAAVKDARERQRDVMMRDCVGKRITEAAMQCVRGAKTSAEIADKCFD